MTIFNLGSINVDYFYHLPHLVTAGETIAARALTIGLGGKGVNQSIAIGRAGGDVWHIGAMGKANADYRDVIAEAGVKTDLIEMLDMPSGHAIVMVEDKSAENQIVIMPAANHHIADAQIDAALQKAKPGDWALTQNETLVGPGFLKQAKQSGLKICFSAAPFVAETAIDLLPLAELLVVNEGEAAALSSHLGKDKTELGLPHLVITYGAKGAEYIGLDGHFHVDSPKVVPVNTTGAGDTYLGYLLASIDAGEDMQSAMNAAAQAAAIQVTREGAADAIPMASELAGAFNESLKENL